jgi:hypothetical protein
MTDVGVIHFSIGLAFILQRIIFLAALRYYLRWLRGFLGRGVLS